MANEDLTVSQSQKGDWWVVEASGTVDVYTSSQLREALKLAAEQRKYKVVVVIHNGTFVDSTGLGLLVGALRRLRAFNGDLRIMTTEARVLKVFEITGLDKVFQIFNELDAAVTADTGLPRNA